MNGTIKHSTRVYESAKTTSRIAGILERCAITFGDVDDGLCSSLEEERLAVAHVDACKHPLVAIVLFHEKTTEERGGSCRIFAFNLFCANGTMSVVESIIEVMTEGLGVRMFLESFSHKLDKSLEKIVVR